MAGSLKRNLLIGLAGGLAGTLAMDAYFAAMARLSEPSGGGGNSDEPATEQVARRALRRAGVKSPSRQTRALGGKAVHWGYGTSWGVITGVARAAGLPLDWGYGQLLGVGLWAGGDLWMTYKLGVARHPREYPAKVHASALGAHLAYGLGLWAALHALDRKDKEEKRRVIRRVA